MKDEIKRIMTLVKDGKLSPEDAAELIDAFSSDGTEEPRHETAEPPPFEPENQAKNGSKDPFRSFVDFIEGIGKEVSDRVEWQQVSDHIRKGAEKGVEGIKSGVEQIKQGRVNFGWFNATEIKETTMPLTIDNKTLRVDNPSGDIKVTSGHAEASVSARAYVRGANLEDAKAKAANYTLVIEESDHQVLIKQPDISGLSVDIVVQLIGPVAVDLKTEAGDIFVRDTQLGCKASTNSGDIQVHGLAGAIEISTQNGDIHAESCTGPFITVESRNGDLSLMSVEGNVSVRTVRGDISAKLCSGSPYSIDSVSGDLVVEFCQPVVGAANIRTVNGSAEVMVPDGCDCRVALATLHGKVTNSVTLTDEAQMDQRVTGRLGEGTGSLDISAVDGDISLKLRDATLG